MSPEEFTQRFGELRAPIVAYLYRRVDANDVDDLAADVFDVAWRRGATVTQGEELPWLYRVAGNLVANYRRKNVRAQRFVASLFAPDSAPSAESIAVADIALAQAWERLPVASREILSLVALDGLSVTEAAVSLDITPNAVSVRLNRARGQLRIALAESS